MKPLTPEVRTVPTQVLTLSMAGIMFALALAAIAGAVWVFSLALRAACSG